MDGDEILVLDRAPKPTGAPEASEPEAAPEAAVAAEEPPAAEPIPPKSGGGELALILNGMALELPGKEGGQPYYLMDLLEYSGIDFAHLDRPVRLAINGHDGTFREVIRSGDQVDIVCL